MNEVILYENRKPPPVVYDISTEEKREEAHRHLFKLLDEWNVFFFGSKKQEEELKRLRNPEIENEDFVFVEGSRNSYVKRVSKDDLEERIEKLESEIETINHMRSLYESAKEGDLSAIRELLSSVKGQPYADFKVVQVQNS